MRLDLRKPPNDPQKFQEQAERIYQMVEAKAHIYAPGIVAQACESVLKAYDGREKSLCLTKQEIEEDLA